MQHSLGQGSAWQLWVSRPSPSQSLPPLCGTGALQWRIRVISPSPHVTEQDDQGDHKLQPPFWRTVSAKQCYYKSATMTHYKLSHIQCLYSYLFGHIFPNCTCESESRVQNMYCLCHHKSAPSVECRSHTWLCTESTLTMETSRPHCPLLDVCNIIRMQYTLYIMQYTFIKYSKRSNIVKDYYSLK